MSYFMQINHLDSSNPLKDVTDESLRLAREQHGLALQLAQPRRSRDDWEKAAALCKMAARAGLPEAQAELGTCYRFGLGTRLNLKKGQHWTRKALRTIMAGSAPFIKTSTSSPLTRIDELREKALHLAQDKHKLALCLFHGTGVQRNVKAAVSLWKEAAHLGVAEAQFQLSQCYRFGWEISIKESGKNKCCNLDERDCRDVADRDDSIACSGRGAICDRSVIAARSNCSIYSCPIPYENLGVINLCLCFSKIPQRQTVGRIHTARTSLSKYISSDYRRMSTLYPKTNI